MTKRKLAVNERNYTVESDHEAPECVRATEHVTQAHMSFWYCLLGYTSLRGLSWTVALVASVLPSVLGSAPDCHPA